MGFFDESEIDQNIDVTDDCSAVQAPAVGDGLIAGKALVGFAVAEGEKRRIGCPDRAGKQRDVAFGYLFKSDPMIFRILAGFGFGSRAVGSGSIHGFTLPSPRQVCYGLGVDLVPVDTLGGGVWP